MLREFRPAAVVAPSEELARSWCGESGQSRGLVVHVNVPLALVPGEKVPTSQWLETDCQPAVSADLWRSVLEAATKATGGTGASELDVAVTTGFTADPERGVRWQPWFDSAGIDRLVAEFDREGHVALARILACTTDHYEFRDDKDVDWSRSWFRNAGLSLAARSRGSVTALDESIDLLNSDMRDLYS